MPIESTLGYYSEPGIMTALGRYAPVLDGLPSEVADLAIVVQGLMLHEHLAEHYGVILSDEDRSAVHVRPVEGLLERIMARDDRPLETARPPAARVAGNCRHFTVLMVAILRAQGTPARARCGFGTYFVDGRFEDHWVCEYWNADEQRWMLVDAQIDDRQRGMFSIDFDVTDVPRDRFLTAGDAWGRCRAGEADPDAFGLSAVNEAGSWWVAQNLVRDAAALGKVELLPWDVWGGMPTPSELIDEDRCALFDRLAALTRMPDASFDELRRLCRDDDALRVPARI